MKKFCFVILHYNEKSLEDTFECIDSIRISCAKYENQYQMIIVENGSGDSSVNVLEQKYQFDKDVDLVISQENLGFAKGNNLGCDFAKSQYHPEFLIVINNDTVIKQSQFLELIDKKYKEYQFDMLGPYIFDRHLRPQNPVPNLISTLSEVEKQIEIRQKPLSKIGWGEQIKYFLKKIPLLIKFESYLQSIKKKNLSKQEQLNIGLHGAALIFSEKYYQKYDDVFYSKTFMFLEENILAYRVKQDKLVSVYCPQIEIYHKEDKATDAIFEASQVKTDWQIKNELDSLNIFRDLLISDK